MNKQGDWMCPSCGHLNFKKRDICQRCSCPKHATAAEVSSCSIQQRTELMPGDWYCGGMNCGAHNYASRTGCYRCGASKEFFGYGAAGMIASTGYAYDAIPGWKDGDWICTRFGCGMHNYASRMECYKCKTPRDFGGGV